MKNRLWLNFGLAVAVAALGLFIYFKPQKGEPEHRLSTLPSSAVDRIRVEIAGQTPVQLARKNADWNLSMPFSARADVFQVQRLLALLDATAKDRFPATGLARFDLNEPYARITLNDQSFSFGAANQMSREQYVLTQGSVYLVALRYGAALPRDALQLASKQLFGPDEALVAFDFKDFRLAQRDGKWEMSPAGADLSQDDFNRWADEWRLATALAVNTASGRKPLATITVQRKDGSDLTLTVMQRDPALVIARGDQKLEYQFAGETTKRLLAPPAAAKPN